MNMSRRLVFGSGSRAGHHLLPEVLELGRGTFAVADVGHLQPHCHPDAYELCFITSGEVEWATPTSRDVLRKRDVYITHPGEMHWGCDSTMHPCTLYWVILGSLDHGYTWPDLDQGAAMQANDLLRQMRPHRLRGTRRAFDALTELFEEHAATRTRPTSQQALGVANARAALHRLVIELVRTSDERNKTHTQSADLLASTQTAIQILLREPHDPQVIRRMCRSMGMNYNQLNEAFVEHLGATISQYCLRQRIRLARARLEQSDASVTEIAAEFGFSSGQHFATTFRRVTGLTPSSCRRTAISLHSPEPTSLNTQNFANR